MNEFNQPFGSRTFKSALLAALGFVALVAVAILPTRVALAAAPTFASASLNDNSATLVTVTITGTDFHHFTASGTATAAAGDLSNITYGGQHPQSASITGATAINAVFTIAGIGTGKSGGALTVAANTVQDAANAGNAGAPDSIANGSITDNAKPVLLSIVINNASSRNSATLVYSEAVTVTNGASTASSGDLTTAGTIAGFGSFATAGNATAVTGKNTVSGSGTTTITILMADQVGGYFNSVSTTSPSGVFTPVASAAVVDANANQASTAGTPTATVTSAWTLTKPIVTSVTLSDANFNGRLDTATVVFSAAVRDANIANGDALLGGAGHVGTFATGTANDATTVFSLTTDNLPYNTSATGADFTYSGATTLITSVYGALLDTATDGTILTADAVEVDGADPVIISTSPANGDTGVAIGPSVIVTFSEPMDFSGCTFASSPNIGGFTSITSASTWHTANGMANSQVNLASVNNYANAASVTITIGGCIAAGGSPTALHANAAVANPFSFTIATVSSGSGVSGGTYSIPTPAISISVPAANTSFTGGSTVGLAWNSSNGAFVKYRVSYSADNGSSWTVLTESAVNPSYSWNIPAVSATQGLIKVEGLDSSGAIIASATSPAFTVSGAASAPAPAATPAASPAVDPTVKGSYTASVAKANNLSINDDKGLVAVSGAACVSGSLIKGSLPAVYFCGADGKRYVFVNDKAFFSWFSGFSDVQTVSDATLASIAIGGNITYRPGVKMVKIVSDPKVYAVARGGVLRWVSSEAVAASLFGSSWNTMIDDVADSFFTNYKIGDPISM